MLQSFSPIQKMVMAILLCIGLIAFGKSWHYTRSYTGTDLECRIRGAKLQAAGYTAYFTSTGAKEAPQLNGVSVPPSVLLLHYPLARLPYHQARMVWFVLQWLLLFGTITLLAGNVSLNPNQYLPGLAGITLFFLAAPHWLLHAERGQLYILYAFLFAVIFRLYGKAQAPAYFAAGFILALAAWFRIFFLAPALPLLLQRKKGFAAGFFTGIISFTLLSLPLLHQWQDYTGAMEAYTNGSSNFVPHSPVGTEALSATGALPATFKNDFTAGCIAYLNDYLRLLHINLPQAIYLAGYTVLLILFCLVNRKRAIRYNTVQIFCLAFLLYIGAEYLLAPSRNPYNLIQWLFPVMLLLPAYHTRSIALLLATGCCLLNAFPLYFPGCFEAGELLLLIAVAQSLSDRNNHPGK